MTDDLVRLGAALELAAGRSIERRRSRVHAIRGAFASLLLAIPFVLGPAPGQLAESTGPLPQVPRIVDTALLPPTIAFMVRHIPDEHAPRTIVLPCLDGLDCRSPIRPSLEPAPPGKV
jgi:hypothetical protein